MKGKKAGEKVGKTIRNLRRNLGISQEVLGEKCHLTQRTISKIELGKWDARLSHLAIIAYVLGVKLSDLFKMAEEWPNPQG